MYIALSPEEVLWTTKKMKKYRLPLVSLHAQAYVCTEVQHAPSE